MFLSKKLSNTEQDLERNLKTKTYDKKYEKILNQLKKTVS